MAIYGLISTSTGSENFFHQQQFPTADSGGTEATRTKLSSGRHLGGEPQKRSDIKHVNMHTRWAPTSYKWGYNPTYSGYQPYVYLVGAHFVNEDENWFWQASNDGNWKVLSRDVFRV